jgi:hypothetical protein
MKRRPKSTKKRRSSDAGIEFRSLREAEDTTAQIKQQQQQQQASVSDFREAKGGLC